MKFESLFSLHFLKCFHNYLIKIILPGIPLGVNLKKYLKDLIFGSTLHYFSKHGHISQVLIKIEATRLHQIC